MNISGNYKCRKVSALHAKMYRYISHGDVYYESVDRDIYLSKNSPLVHGS